MTHERVTHSRSQPKGQPRFCYCTEWQRCTKLQISIATLYSYYWRVGPAGSSMHCLCHHTAHLTLNGHTTKLRRHRPEKLLSMWMSCLLGACVRQLGARRVAAVFRGRLRRARRTCRQVECGQAVGAAPVGSRRAWKRRPSRLEFARLRPALGVVAGFLPCGRPQQDSASAGERLRSGAGPGGRCRGSQWRRAIGPAGPRRQAARHLRTYSRRNHPHYRWAARANWRDRNAR